MVTAFKSVTQKPRHFPNPSVSKPESTRKILYDDIRTGIPGLDDGSGSEGGNGERTMSVQ